MRPRFFRLFGGLTLLLSPLVLAAPGKSLVLFAAVVVVGVGLLFLRKWAALYFSVPLFGFGSWIALSTITMDPFPSNLLVMVYSVSLMLPLVITIRVWRQLVWRGKWFF
jgi:hypothetical protein